SMSWAKSRKTEHHAKSNNIFHRQATGPRTRKCAPFTSAMNDQMLDEPALARFPICGGLCFQRPRGKKEYHPSLNGVLAAPLAEPSKKLYKAGVNA
ncbi:MAG: hypothetical protein WCF47_15575, partial [Pseudolabrys sp.]